MHFPLNQSFAVRSTNTLHLLQQHGLGITLLGQGFDALVVLTNLMGARTLARLARIDPGLLCPVKHRSRQAHPPRRFQFDAQLKF